MMSRLVLVSYIQNAHLPEVGNAKSMVVASVTFVFMSPDSLSAWVVAVKLKPNVRPLTVKVDGTGAVTGPGRESNE